MKSDISSFASEFNEEELKFIKDYFKFVKSKMNNPSHPEIHIGAARYPLGRFIVKRNLIPAEMKELDHFISKLRNEKFKARYQSIVDDFNNLIPIVDEVKKKGKSIKSSRRKRLNESKD